MSLPATMRYVEHGAGGGPEVLRVASGEVPEVGAGDVLIEVVAAGVNRPDEGGRTAPSAMHAQEIDLYAALPTGLYRYEPLGHRLALAIDSDVRRVTGYQDFVDNAALDLVYVADHRRMGRVPAGQRASYASCTAGAMAQNVYLVCASAGLATVLRAWFDRPALSHAMGLVDDEQVLFAQTVGMRGTP